MILRWLDGWTVWFDLRLAIFLMSEVSEFEHRTMPRRDQPSKTKYRFLQKFDFKVAPIRIYEAAGRQDHATYESNF